MNLQEDIQRIKEVMGINESELTQLKRRMDELPKCIKAAYTWLNPRDFNTLDEFIQRGAFSSTRDFILDEYNEYRRFENLDKIAEELYPFILRYIEENFLDEIKDYYNRYP